MHRLFHLTVAAIAAFAVMHVFAGPVMAQEAVKQIKLTEQQVQGFIAAHKAMSGGDGGADKDKADSKNTDAQLDAIAKQHGFASLDEYDEVEANILMVMDGIDPQTKAFIEPPEQIKRRIEELKAEKTIPQKEKDQQLAELTELAKTAKPVQFRENIELVKKYWDKIDAVLQ